MKKLALFVCVVLASCGGGGGSSPTENGAADKISPAGALDQTSPAIVRPIPDVADFGAIPANSIMGFEFSEAIDPKSIENAGITVRDRFGKIQGKITAEGNFLYFKPAEILRANEIITLSALAQITDLSGNRLISDFTWHYTATPTPDLTPPKITSTLPSNSALEIDINSPVLAVFDEAIRITPESKVILSDGKENIASGFAVSGNKIEISRLKPLAPLVAYTVKISGLTDASGNLAPEISWGFKTKNVIPTIISSSAPPSGITNIKVIPGGAYGFSFQFSNPIASIDPVSFSISPPDLSLLSVKATGNLVIADFRGTPKFGTEYTISIDLSGVKDTYGLALVGKYTYKFRTEPPYPQEISGTIPSDLGFIKGPSSPIYVNFTKNIDLTTCTSASFSVAGVEGVIKCAARQLTFTPKLPFELNASYLATVSTSLKDIDGINLSKPYSFTFKTKYEYEPPVVMATSTSRESIQIVFNEAVYPFSVYEASFKIEPKVNGVFSTNGEKSTFTPTQPLPMDTDYRVTISGLQNPYNSNGVRDLLGNFMEADYILSFKTDPGTVDGFSVLEQPTCSGVANGFSIGAINKTPYTQTVNICINRAVSQTNSYMECTEKVIQPGGGTGKVLYSCFSTGQYTVSWQKTDGSGPVTTKFLKADGFTSTYPVVNPCSVSSSIPQKNCGLYTETPPPPTSTTPNSTPAIYPVATLPDEDGCFIPQRSPSPCLLAQGSFTTSGSAKVVFTNQCTGRVYVNACLKHNDDSWDCGSFGVDAGKSGNWWSSQSTGEYKYVFTGSNRWANDWVCTPKDPGFVKIN